VRSYVYVVNKTYLSTPIIILQSVVTSSPFLIISRSTVHGTHLLHGHMTESLLHDSAYLPPLPLPLPPPPHSSTGHV
jgi:hypothetical protein